MTLVQTTAESHRRKLLINNVLYCCRTEAIIPRNRQQNCASKYSTLSLSHRSYPRKQPGVSFFVSLPPARSPYHRKALPFFVVSHLPPETRQYHGSRSTCLCLVEASWGKLPITRYSLVKYCTFFFVSLPSPPLPVSLPGSLRDY